MDADVEKLVKAIASIDALGRTMLARMENTYSVPYTAEAYQADRKTLLAALDAVEADARAANLWLLTAPPPETVALDALVEERQDANRQLHAELQRVMQAAAQAAAFQP